MKHVKSVVFSLHFRWTTLKYSGMSIPWVLAPAFLEIWIVDLLEYSATSCTLQIACSWSLQIEGQTSFLPMTWSSEIFLEIGNVPIELINPSTKNETVIEHEPSQRTVLVPSICNCFYKLVWESTNKCGNLTWTQPYWTSYDANLTAYRTSNHKLATEISWWSTISILRDNRICHFCAQSQCSWKWDTLYWSVLSLYDPLSNVFVILSFR